MTLMFFVINGMGIRICEVETLGDSPVAVPAHFNGTQIVRNALK